MQFPLKKKRITFNHSESQFLPSYKEDTEIPILPHPGAFSKKRMHHQHEGIDLYCEEGDEIFSMEDGIIINIFPFTGEQVNTGWWNNTWAILVESNSGVFNYGELIPNPNLVIGQSIVEGQYLGNITPVLKKNKGRPMNMLHLEMYVHGTKKALSSWDLNIHQPIELLDPTQFLIQIATCNKLLKG